MRLTKVRVTEFQSIQDSTEFDIGDVTCLVGKNEAGKTALLKALYRLKPIIETEGDFDVTDDYPRRSVTDYENDVEAKRREPAQVIQATYAIEPGDVTAVETVFGPNCLKGDKPTLTLNKGYTNTSTFNGLNVNNRETLKYLVTTAGLPQPLTAEIVGLEIDKMVEALNNAEQTKAVEQLTSMLQDVSKDGVEYLVHNSILRQTYSKVSLLR